VRRLSPGLPDFLVDVAIGLSKTYPDLHKDPRFKGSTNQCKQQNDELIIPDGVKVYHDPNAYNKISVNHSTEVAT